MKNEDNGDNDFAKLLEPEADRVNELDRADLLQVKAVMDEAEGLALEGLFDQAAFKRIVNVIRSALPPMYNDYLDECKAALIKLLS